MCPSGGVAALWIRALKWVPHSLSLAATMRGVGQLQAHKARDQDDEIDLAESRLQPGQSAGRMAEGRDVAIAQRRQGHEAEVNHRIPGILCGGLAGPAESQWVAYSDPGVQQSPRHTDE